MMWMKKTGVMAPVHCEARVPVVDLVGVVHLETAHLLPRLEAGEQEDREELFRGVLCVDLVLAAACCRHSHFQPVSHPRRLSP